MSYHTAITIMGKLGLLLLPFIILFSVYLPNARSSYALQQSVLRDKIERLVISSTQKPRVIIAGDSRAEYSVIPDLFAQKTNLSTVNIAVGGGTLSEMYDMLSETGVLNNNRLIIISISSYEINDNYPDERPINWLVATKKPSVLQKATGVLTYLETYVSSYYTGLRRFLRGDTTDYAHMNQATFLNKGYVPQNGLIDPTTMVGNTSWYVNLQADGVKRQDFERSIRGFGNTNDTVVLYEGPIAPAWQLDFAKTAGPAAEEHFSTIIRAAIAPYSNLHFINFQSANIPELGDKEFLDVVHLNTEGASVFTSLLVERLKKERLLPR